LLNPKLATTLPCGANLETPNPPPHSISFPHVGQIPAIVLPVPSPSFSPIHLLFVHNLHTSTPTRSPLCMGRVPLTWRLFLTNPSTQLSLPCLSSLRAWVGFPSTWLLLPCPSLLCTWVGLVTIWFSFIILCYEYLIVSSRMCMNLMQVGKAQFQKLKGAWTSLVWTSCSSFSIAKSVQLGCLVLLFWCPFAN
jgi:hypothetical protein